MPVAFEFADSYRSSCSDCHTINRYNTTYNQYGVTVEPPKVTSIPTVIPAPTAQVAPPNSSCASSVKRS